MDDLDKAKELEMQHRAESLEDALAKPDHSPGERAMIIEGVHHCIDCGEPIPLRRMAIKPDALCCVDCKDDWEKNNQ